MRVLFPVSRIKIWLFQPLYSAGDVPGSPFFYCIICIISLSHPIIMLYYTCIIIWYIIIISYRWQYHTIHIILQYFILHISTLHYNFRLSYRCVYHTFPTLALQLENSSIPLLLIWYECSSKRHNQSYRPNKVKNQLFLLFSVESFGPTVANHSQRSRVFYNPLVFVIINSYMYMYYALWSMSQNRPIHGNYANDKIHYKHVFAMQW